MKGQGQKLTRKRELAIAALLTESTIAEAAKKAGVAEVTIWRWMKLEEFADAYKEARREAVQQAIGQLQQNTGLAAAVLLEVAQDPLAPASSRVAASRTILEAAFKALELEDLHSRLQALENYLEEAKELNAGIHENKI